MDFSAVPTCIQASLYAPRVRRLSTIGKSVFDMFEMLKCSTCRVVYLLSCIRLLKDTKKILLV